MNGLKKKVIASAAMLLVAAVMLTSSSFAWYTISTKGDVQQIKAELRATDNLEIARATSSTVAPAEADLNQADDQTYWGSVVSEWGTPSEIPMDVPATWSSAAVKTADYGTTGRVGSLVTANPTAVNLIADKGVYKYTATVNGKEVKVANAYCLWLRTNNQLTDLLATVTGKDNTTGLVLRFRPVGTTAWNYATFDNNGVASLKEANGKIAADTPYYIEIITYFEGDKLLADAVNAGKTDTFQVLFTSKTIDDQIKATKSETDTYEPGVRIDDHAQKASDE